MYNMFGSWGSWNQAGLAPFKLGPWAWVFAPLAIWSLIWKGLALWRAGRNNQLAWFIALLVINSLGILEIIYLIFFAKEKLAFLRTKSSRRKGR